MDYVIVYTIGCPACNILEKKLKQKDIQYIRVEDEAEFKILNITQFPKMQVNCGPLMSYKEAVNWVNSK